MRVCVPVRVRVHMDGTDRDDRRPSAEGGTGRCRTRDREREGATAIAMAVCGYMRLGAPVV